MRTICAPYIWVPRTFAGSRSAGIKMHAVNPARAACAATALARLPVEEQLTTSNPKFLAYVSATATTRSLKLRVGKHTASFLRYNDRLRTLSPSLAAFIRGVKPAGVDASYVSGSGSSSL